VFVVSFTCVVLFGMFGDLVVLFRGLRVLFCFELVLLIVLRCFSFCHSSFCWCFSGWFLVGLFMYFVVFAWVFG